MAHPEEQDLQRIDAVLSWSAVLVRAFGYALLVATASHYDFGRALLTGVFLGDLGGQVVTLVWNRGERLAPTAWTLALLAATWIFARSTLGWPDDPAQRAVLVLAGFGAFVGAVGGSALTRFGRDEGEFA